LGYPRVDRHLLIFISSGSTQLCGFSRPGSIISSHFLPRLLELEPFSLTNSICALNGRLQMLLRLCMTTICGQIDRMYIFSNSYIMHAILLGSESCDCNKDEYDRRNALCLWNTACGFRTDMHFADVLNDPIPTHGRSWPQRHNVPLQ